jgi:Zinc knuckle
MDVDLVELGKGRLSEAERKKLQAEGRCFFCKAQGHMSRQCPKKGGRTGNTQNSVRPRPIAAQIAEIEENAPISANTVVETPDRKAVLKGILGMSAEERTQLLDELILNDQPSLSF